MSASTITALESLRQIEPPKELSRQALWEASLSAFLTEKVGLREIIDILKSDDFRQEVLRGKVTIGMIKPSLDEAVKDEAVQSDTDWDRAQELIQVISDKLDVILQISIRFTEAMVNQFYEGMPKDTQMTQSPANPNRYGQTHQTRWEEFVALMTGAPATFLILAKEDGRAIETWRKMMGGSWDISQAEPNSLRATYPIENHNNVFHGSDSPASVFKELDFLIAYLEESISLQDEALK